MLNYDKIIIGDNMRAIRKKSNMTLEAICQKAEVTEQHLKRIELGGRGMSIDLLFKLMTIYDVDANTLLNIKISDNENDSIDRMLMSIPRQDRDYLKTIFIDMITNLPVRGAA